LYEAADGMTDKETKALLEGTPILARRNILRLISEAPVETWYCDDGWVDYVAEYVCRNRKSLGKLITHIKQLAS
jgi:hypothetical protein